MLIDLYSFTYFSSVGIIPGLMIKTNSPELKLNLGMFGWCDRNLIHFCKYPDPYRKLKVKEYIEEALLHSTATLLMNLSR